MVFVSMEELARLANTSVATVSRALAGKPGVSERKRESIRQLAERLGYEPNQLVRCLLTRTSNTLGFVAANLTDRSRLRLLRPMEATARDNGFEILVADSRGSVELEQANIRSLLRNRVAGLVIFPVWESDSDAEATHLLDLQAQRVPFVIGGAIDGFGFDSVCGDDRGAGCRIARHLLELGHRRFGVVGCDPRNRLSRERLQGVEDALHEAGLIHNGNGGRRAPVLRLAGLPKGGESMREMIRGEVGAWLRGRAAPTALVCLYNHVALRLVRIVQDLGARIPGDVSVATFDDDEWCRCFTPSLTATAQNYNEMGRLLFDTLLRRIDSPQAPFALDRLPMALQERESTAPPRR